MTTTPASAANERDLFETWARTCDGNCNENDLRKWSATAYQLTEDGETYVDALVERDWIVWQAARAIPQPAAEPVTTEGWLIEWRHPGGRKDYAFHRHNAVGDYRAIYDDVTACELARRTPDRAPSADSAAPKLPSTPEAVMAMFRCHYSQQITHTEEGAPLDPEDVAFTLTVHDILSAFDDWQDGEASADSAADTRAAFDVFMATPEAEFYNATHETAWIIWQGASRGSAADALDAARYRWIREEGSIKGAIEWNVLGVDCHDLPAMDAAIDQAIAAMPKEAPEGRSGAAPDPLK